MQELLANPSEAVLITAAAYIILVSFMLLVASFVVLGINGKMKKIIRNQAVIQDELIELQDRLEGFRKEQNVSKFVEQAADQL